MRIIGRETASRYHRQVKKELLKQGYKIIDKGWPDFICLKGRSVRFIEVKAPNGRLSNDQENVHAILKRLGIKIEVLWSEARRLLSEE